MFPTLLKIPGLMLAGGVGLVWIAYKLLAPQEGDDPGHPHATTFWGAMKTIVIAETNEDALVMWAHEAQRAEYSELLDGIERQIDGETVVEDPKRW